MDKISELNRIFQDPSAEHRGIPFWSWNCKVTEEMIDWQLDCFRAMGFGGVVIHPRVGLDVVYLGDEYLRLTKYAVEKCREKGLVCWLYDDDRFPSGAAGGIVTKDWRMRGRYLLLTERHGEGLESPLEGDRTGIMQHGRQMEKWKDEPKLPETDGVCAYLLPEYCRNAEEFEEAASGTPIGYFAAAYAIDLQDGFLAGYRCLTTDEEIHAALQRGERVRFAYVRLLEEERWFEGEAYLDTMNPAAVRAFLESTHEKYYELLGDEFGGSVPSIFTDEPRMAPRKKRPFKLSAALSDEDIVVPYTEYFRARMMEKYGTDPLGQLPEYVWELPDGEKSAFRYRYQDMLAECFAGAFMDQISDWCAEHGIMMTGHVLSEDSLQAQTWALGDCMRCYREMDMPGVDVLVDYRQFVTVKQAASVAKQRGLDGGSRKGRNALAGSEKQNVLAGEKRRSGCEGVVSELYGVTGWDFDFKTYKLQGDWQAALGVTVRVPHLAWMSMEGEAKRDWPASIFYQSPWYTQFPMIEDYFARLHTVLTRGKAVTRVAVIHPVESAWLLMGPNDQTGDALSQMSRSFDELVRWLLLGCVDFDFVSESLLEEYASELRSKCGKCVKHAEQNRMKKETHCAVFSVGQMAYEVILVPGFLTIRGTTLDRLEQFAAKGGTVLFVGTAPAYVDGVRSDRAALFAEKCAEAMYAEEAAAEITQNRGILPWEKNVILNALEPWRDVEIRGADGTRSDNLFYQLRQDEGFGWLFLCHVYPRPDAADQAEQYQIRLRGDYHPVMYDAMTGECAAQVSDFVTVCKDGDNVFTEIPWTCYAQDSLLLRLDPAADREDLGPENDESCGMETGISCAPAVRDISRRPDFETVLALRKPDTCVRSEPNMLLLDYARYQLDGGPISEKMEILRLDNRIRSQLGLDPRREDMEQPWFMKETERHAVTLYYDFRSESDTSTALGIERAENCRIWLNGEEVTIADSMKGYSWLCGKQVLRGFVGDTDGQGSADWYVDQSIRVIPLPDIRPGENRLKLEVRFNQKSNLENLYLLGDFDVKLRGSQPIVCLRKSEQTLGDITDQGMPFYTGNLDYQFRFRTEEAGEYAVQIRRFAAPLLGIQIDGRDAGQIAFAPHRLELGYLNAGEHELTVRLYGNRFNGFGHLHNADRNFEWIGPAAYRTEGDQWTDSYLLRPAGLFSEVEIQRVMQR